MIPTFFWQPIQDFCIRTKNRLWSIPTPVSRDVTQNENVSLNNPFQEHNNSLGNELEKCATDAFIHPSRIRKTQGWNSLDSLTRWIIYKEMSLFFSFQFKIFFDNCTYPDCMDENYRRRSRDLSGSQNYWNLTGTSSGMYGQFILKIIIKKKIWSIQCNVYVRKLIWRGQNEA